MSSNPPSVCLSFHSSIISALRIEYRPSDPSEMSGTCSQNVALAPPPTNGISIEFEFDKNLKCSRLKYAVLPLYTFYPSALRAGGVYVLLSRFGRAGGCQTCGTHISVTAWRIFSIQSSVELSRPVVVHCHGHLPICSIWACPWAKNLSNLPQIGSRLCRTHISETAGWIYPI